MIYGPGFVEALVIIALVCRGIFSLEKLDKNAGTEPKWKQVPRNRVLSGIFMCSLLTCTVSAAGADGEYYLRVLLLGVVSGGLLAAWVMDVETHMIYDFVWWISGSAAFLLLVFSENARIVRWDITVFIVLQQLVFGRLYGRADCHAFSVCALVEGAFGMTMQDYLMHMLIALCILTVVQLAKSNVTGDGRLKEPVPFLPYIAVSFIYKVFFVYLCIAY